MKKRRLLDFEKREKRERAEAESRPWIEAAHEIMKQLDDETQGGFWFVSIIVKLAKANPRMPVKEIERMLGSFMPKSFSAWNKYIEET